MTAPKPETQALKAWCESTPGAPRYMTAYVWMRRNEASVEQVIEYYTRQPEPTVQQKCVSAGLSYDAIRCAIHKHGWTPDQAIEHYLTADRRTIKDKALAMGLSPKTVWGRMHRDQCTAEQAIERILARKLKPSLGIKPLAEQSGVSYSRIYAYMRDHGCDAETAAQALQGIESARQPKANPEPEKSTSDLLSKAWV